MCSLSLVLFPSRFPLSLPSSISPFISLFPPLSLLFLSLPLPASSTLRQELEKERYFQKQLLDKPRCTCCEQRLGRLFNTGAPCPNCLYRVCKRCRVLSEKPPPPFVCPVCAKKRYTHVIIIIYIYIYTTRYTKQLCRIMDKIKCDFSACYATLHKCCVQPLFCSHTYIYACNKSLCVHCTPQYHVSFT